MTTLWGSLPAVLVLSIGAIFRLIEALARIAEENSVRVVQLFCLRTGVGAGTLVLRVASSGMRQLNLRKWAVRI